MYVSTKNVLIKKIISKIILASWSIYCSCYNYIALFQQISASAYIHIKKMLAPKKYTVQLIREDLYWIESNVRKNDMFGYNVLKHMKITHAAYNIMTGPFMQRIKHCVGCRMSQTDFSNNCTVEKISAYIAHSFTWISRESPLIPISPI